MTLQQLTYIVALDKHRHFALAAEACGITQPTLSLMIQKLEQELDVLIFDRTTYPITPTKIGERIIAQAKISLYHTQGVQELVRNEREELSGSIQMAIIPTVAPYILPKFIGLATEKLPNLNLSIFEQPTSRIITQLLSADIDLAIMATPIQESNLLEIPLYYERFYAYISPKELSMYQQEEVDSSNLSSENIWLLREGHCLRKQVLNLCSKPSIRGVRYDGGSIETLVRIVDNNAGYTIIPELHLESLSEWQRQHVRALTSPTVTREISFVVRKDFIREQTLNELASIIRQIIPPEMLNSRLKKFTIKL